MNIKVSDLIAEFLEKIGVETVFGIIGSANSHIFDSIAKRGYTQIVCVHHEQAAVMAMGAYFRASGKIAASIVTAGAGSSNAITGVLSNWADSIPGIIISGQEKCEYIEKYDGLRMYGIQGFDSSTAVKKFTKYSKTIKEADMVQSIFEYAYFSTKNQRPGPVWLDIPFDIQSKIVDHKEWNLTFNDISVQYDAASVLIGMDIDYIIKQLANAKRPVIWAGHGIRLKGANVEFKKLVDILKIPVILTWGGIDLLDDEYPFYFGRAGVNGIRYSNFIIQNCDFLLVIGNRLSILQTGYDINQFAPKAKIAVVDVDRNEWKKHPSSKYDRVIFEDCKNFIIELLNKSPIIGKKPDWLKYCNDIKIKYPPMGEDFKDGGLEYVNSYTFIDTLCNYIDDDAIIVTDMGTALLSGHYAMRLKPKQLMFTSLGLGEMGYGLPGAIGASFAYPNRQIICLNCDGGMMMNLQELQTIVHHKLPIKIVVFNNDGYLMIKHTQNMLFKGYRTSVSKNTGVSLPNYREIGGAFKICSLELKGCNFDHNIIKKWLSEKDSAILDVFMDPNQDFIPKVKGVINKDGTITPAPLEEMSPLLPYNDIENIMISGINEKSKLIKRM